VRDLGLAHTSAALDLAAGTGKLARVLVPLLGRVIAVEPTPAMLDTLRAQLPEVEAKMGTAEAIPLPAASVDAVFVGEAFHWFQLADACAEIARVLRPAGNLVVVWQRPRWSEHGHAWIQAFDELIGPHRETAGYPAGDGHWRVALAETALFEPLTLTEADYDHRLRPDDFVALVESWSWIANLADESRTDLLAAVRELLPGDSELVLRYRTEIYSTRLVPLRG
jgi:SAM-dependent methyltransferase